MKNTNFELFKKDFKRDLLIQIVINLKHGKISRPSSSELAREVLGIFREGQAKQVFERINKLTETYPDILDIFIKRGYEFDTREREEKTNQILVYLKLKGGETN